VNAAPSASASGFLENFLLMGLPSGNDWARFGPPASYPPRRHGA
jgi:hypothetical protein